MGVGQYVEVLAFVELYRSHVVDIDKRTYHSFLPEGQDTAYDKIADIGGPFFDNEVDVRRICLFTDSKDGISFIHGLYCSLISCLCADAATVSIVFTPVRVVFASVSTIFFTV